MRLLGFCLFVVGCELPAFLYATQPRVGITLALVGAYALAAVLWPVGRKR